MMKKLVAMGIAVLVLSLVAAPAMAHRRSDGIDIDNYAKVFTKVETKADSGDNSIGGMLVLGGKIFTRAATAGALVSNDVNSSVLGCVRCDGDVDIDNHAKVFTKVYTKADSGDNSIGGMIVSGGKISTGAAGATSIVDNLVNFTMVGYMPY